MSTQPDANPCFSLDPEGYFRDRSGKRLFAVGVNYWPASSGLRMWESWDEAAIAADLDLVRRLGFNTVRFFLRWQDFEPEAGVYSQRQFDRLDWLLAQFARRGLLAQPSLFVGWMSGGIFWPEWKQGKNVFSDAFMVERAEAFARRAARIFARHRTSVLAVDLGNEMACLPDAKSSTYEEIAAWCSRLTGAIKDEFPGVLTVSGCDMGQVTNDSPWAFDNQPGTDFYSIHAYPVSNWASVPVGGLDDPLSRRLFAFYCAYSRAYGPTLFQEFGTILTLGDEVQRDYLAEALPAVAAAGVNGMLWWCLHDIHSLEHPYLLGEMEQNLGLVDAEGRVKPPLADAVRQLRAWAADPDTLPRPAATDLALYVPDAIHSQAPYYLRHPNPQSLLGRRYLIAWHLAWEAGLAPAIVRSSSLPVPGSVPLLFAGSSLLPSERERLLGWVRAGGQLVVHGLSGRNWGAAHSAFFGARCVNYTLNAPRVVSYAGASWTFPAPSDDNSYVIEPVTATVLARDQSGHPVVLCQTHGEGQITYALVSPEDAAAHDRARALSAGDRWRAWFHSLAPVTVA